MRGGAAAWIVEARARSLPSKGSSGSKTKEVGGKGGEWEGMEAAPVLGMPITERMPLSTC